jgi:phage virion morphogenesis protein
MAGARIRLDDGYIEFDDGGTLAMLKRLQDLGADMEAPFADVGEYLLRATEERFDSEAGPAGVPWLEVAPETRARKKHPKILTESGRLRGSFSYHPSEDELLFGTNVIYAAIHQFGGDEVGKNIPPRPFLGFDSTDEFEITAIFLRHIDQAAKG